MATHSMRGQRLRSPFSTFSSEPILAQRESLHWPLTLTHSLIRSDGGIAGSAMSAKPRTALVQNLVIDQRFVSEQIIP